MIQYPFTHKGELMYLRLRAHRVDGRRQRRYVEAGLVDELGGLGDAVRAAAEAAGIDRPDRVELVHLPERGGLVSELLDSLTARAAPVWLGRLGTLSGEIVPSYTELGPGLHALAGTAFVLN